MVMIAGRALGRKKPLFADFSIPIPPESSEGGGITLRQLIGRIVQDEVAAFQKRQQDRQFLRVLTEREIAEGAERGKIEMGESAIVPQKVDPAAAVATAVQAFEDGLYLIVIDENEQKDLEKEVFLQPESRITFIRLTLLAGG